MKTTRILASIACLALYIQPAFANTLSVEQIEVQDAQSIRATFSENPNLKEGNIDAEIKVLHDVKVREVTKRETEENQIELTLKDSIMTNTSYSLLNISGAEGSIDFNTEETLEGFEAFNDSSDQEQDIDSIVILDDTTMIITYREDIEAENYEFKLLAEHEIASIQKSAFSTPELLVSVNPPLQADANYILMFIELQDVDGNYLEFDTGIYDFSTWSDIVSESNNSDVSEEVVEAAQEVEELPEAEELPELNTAGLVKEGTQPKVIETLDDIIVEEESLEDTDTLDALREITDLNEGSDIADIQDIQESISVREAASLVSQHPETGPTTWIVILMSIFINTFYYFTRRKKTLSV